MLLFYDYACKLVNCSYTRKIKCYRGSCECACVGFLLVDTTSWRPRWKTTYIYWGCEAVKLFFFFFWLHLEWRRSQTQTHTNSFQLICETNYFLIFFKRKFELPPQEWLHSEKFTTFLMYAWTSKRTPYIHIVYLLLVCGKTSQKRQLLIVRDEFNAQPLPKQNGTQMSVSCNN